MNLDDLNQYVFPEKSSLEEIGYKVFPVEFEVSQKHFFHGTSVYRAKKILLEGFKKGSSVGSDLESISFAKQSALSLRYACEKAKEDNDQGCILVVEVRADKEYYDEDSATISICRDDLEIVIVGICYVPEKYEHT